MGAIALQLESKGVPTSFVVFEEHEATFVAQAGLGGFGYIPVSVVAADEVMDAQDARAAGQRVAGSVVTGLIRPGPEYLEVEGNRWVPQPATFTFSGATAMDALDAFNEAYLANGWGDGLPLIPPTPDRVRWLLTGTDRAPDEILGKMGPSQGFVTPERLAVQAAMAGARPEHMAVILAAFQAILSYPYDYYGALLRGVAPMVIVNGPIVEQLGINHAANEMGPNPRHSAGSVIGRAINLALRNLGGFGRGLIPVGQHGQPGQYTGLVIGEAERVVPWVPLNVELGQPEGSNTVTVLAVTGSLGAPGREVAHAASFVPPSISFWPSTRVGWQRRAMGVLLLTPFSARRMALEGKTKEDVKKALYDLARVPRDEFERIWAVDEGGATALVRWLLRTIPEDQPIPIAASPDNFIVVVAGGWDSSLTSAWLFTDQFMSTPVTRVIELPKQWSELLRARQAIADPHA